MIHRPPHRLPRRFLPSPPGRHALPGLALLLCLAPTGSAAAQGLLPTVAGGGAGLVAGGLVSVGVVSLRARQGDYLYSVGDALGWEAAPVLLGTVGGAALGATDRQRLGGAAAGSLVGWLAGAGAGYLVGRRAWEAPEGAWAGLAVGGATGLLGGAVLGFVLAGDDGDRDGSGGAPLPLLAVAVRF